MAFIADTFHLSPEYALRREEKSLTEAPPVSMADLVRTLRSLPSQAAQQAVRAADVHQAAKFVHNAFTWTDTREGHKFWWYVAERLEEISRKEM